MEKMARKGLFKATILLPILFVCYIYLIPTNIYIGELHLAIWERTLSLCVLVFTMLWLCCSPLRHGCQNGGWFELLFNLYPVELFLFAVFAQWHFGIAVLLLAAMSAAIAFCGMCLWKERSKQNLTKKQIKINRITFQRLFVLISFVFMVVPGIFSSFVYDLQGPHYEAQQELLEMLFAEDGHAADAGSDGDILQENQQLLWNFRAEKWDAQSTQDKITLLQALVDMEAKKLGIPAAKTVTEKLPPYIVGQHSGDDDMIWIDIEHINSDSIKEVLHTCLHETYHSFQAYVVRNIDWDSEFSECALFDEARTWKANQAGYIRGAVDYEAYEAQPLEASADRFAEKETAAILALIAETG